MIQRLNLGFFASFVAVTDGVSARLMDVRSEDVRHLIAAVEHAYIGEARLRVRQHVEVQFDLLRATAGNLHRLAESPFRNIQRRCRLLQVQTKLPARENPGCPTAAAI